MRFIPLSFATFTDAHDITNKNTAVRYASVVYYDRWTVYSAYRQKYMTYRSL